MATVWLRTYSISCFVALRGWCLCYAQPKCTLGTLIFNLKYSIISTCRSHSLKILTLSPAKIKPSMVLLFPTGNQILAEKWIWVTVYVLMRGA